jgi:hypothetical protein
MEITLKDKNSKITKHFFEGWASECDTEIDIMPVIGLPGPDTKRVSIGGEYRGLKIINPFRWYNPWTWFKKKIAIIEDFKITSVEYLE